MIEPWSRAFVARHSRPRAERPIGDAAQRQLRQPPEVRQHERAHSDMRDAPAQPRATRCRCRPSTRSTTCRGRRRRRPARSRRSPHRTPARSARRRRRAPGCRSGSRRCIRATSGFTRRRGARRSRDWRRCRVADLRGRDRADGERVGQRDRRFQLPELVHLHQADALAEAVDHDGRGGQPCRGTDRRHAAAPPSRRSARRRRRACSGRP